MLTHSAAPLRRLFATAAVALPVAIANCAPVPPTASVMLPPIPPGEARVWFYRDGGPYVDGTGTPYLRMNEAIVGVSQPEGAMYRDVAPGQYHVTVDSYGTDFNQSRWVYLYPGQQAYFKIVSLRDWVVGGGGGRNGGGYQRNTFYVWEIPPEIAQGDVAHSRFYGGG
jgi:hypothetical protein